jgi:photosystem I reaction center subunit VIII
LPQAEAAQLVATVAASAGSYPFVPPAYLPSVLVPTVGLLVPAIAMAWVRRRADAGAGPKQGVGLIVSAAVWAGPPRAAPTLALELPEPRPWG